jgi:hypothetical protein
MIGYYLTSNMVGYFSNLTRKSYSQKKRRNTKTKRKINERIIINNIPTIYIMAKKKDIKQKQKQKQSTNIVIKINNAGRKKTTRKPRKVVAETPMRQLPPVVYQTLPQLTFYTTPSPTGSIVAPPAPPSSIVSPIPPKTSIMEMQDVGVGTEGFVQILDLPSKRETLSGLITPVSTAPVPRKPLKIIPEPQPVRKPIILDTPPVVIDSPLRISAS